jgi:polyisoprenoid-binding protein YceI
MTITETRTTAVAPQRWHLDHSDTTVEFTAKTFWGLSTVHGRFDRFDGLYEIGPFGPRIELTVDASSLDTGNATRDTHLRSDEFFHVRQHPQVRFTSTRVRDEGEGTLHVEGRLTAAGRVVPIALDAVVLDAAEGVEIDGATAIDHRLFGMSSGPLGMIRPPVTLRVKAHLHAV